MILLYSFAIHGLDLDLSSAHRNLRSDHQQIFELKDQQGRDLKKKRDIGQGRFHIRSLVGNEALLC